MFDAQTSALAVQNLGELAPSARHPCSAGFQTCRTADFQIGRPSTCGELAGLEGCATVPGPKALSFLEIETTSLPVLTDFISLRFRANQSFKIKNLLQKIKTYSSSPIKSNQGFIDEKNSEFISRQFYGKSLANPQKTPQKTRQISPKNLRFMTDFLSHHFINDSQNSDRQNKLLPFRNGVNI